MTDSTRHTEFDPQERPLAADAQRYESVKRPTPEQSGALRLATPKDAEQLFRMRRRHVVPVDQPMVLIGQIQRMGGTLLNSLLDGHPQVHAHPFQLKFADIKYDWPDGLTAKNEAEAEATLAVLRQVFIRQKFGKGYSKQGTKTSEQQPLPFSIVPSFMASLFVDLCRKRQPESTRDVLNCYFSALFNAWMDLEGLRLTPKRWLVAFAPRMGWGVSRERFWRDYPDGRLIFVVRDPRAWFASEAGLPRHKETTDYTPRWIRNAKETLAAKAQDPDRVLVVTYEAIVRDAETTMRAIADWLDLAFDPILTQPTFNRLATEPNSSHDIAGHGVKVSTLDRWRSTLSPETIEGIEERTATLNKKLLAQADIS
jgi:hypothetical protein